MSYSRPQLKLLLLLAVTLCAGLGVREWRAGFPDLAERLERFDREPAGAGPVSGAIARHTDARAAGEAASTTGDGAVTGETASAAGRSTVAAPSGAPTGDTAGTARARPVHAGSSGMSPAGETAAARVSPPAPPPVDARPVDINRAGLGELARLPGIGPAMAARIVAERDRHGRFDSPDALRAVLGMGPKKLAAIRELITVSE